MPSSLTSASKRRAFVPGRTCMADIDKVSNCFRLNYTTVSNEKIDEGMKILGDILKEYV